MTSPIHVFTPRKELRSLVESFDVRRGGDAVSVSCGLPCVDTNIVLNFGVPLRELLSSGGLKTHPRFAVYGCGPTLARYEWRPGVDMIIARLKPGAAGAFLENPCSDFVNDVVPLEDDWGFEARLLGERICGVGSPLRRVMMFEDSLLRRLSRRQSAPPSMIEALRLIESNRGMLPIGRFTEALGVTQRHLNRHFGRWVGMSLKLVSRVVRFNSLTERLREGQGVDWGQEVYDFGFSDQSHLIREFRQFTGMTPTTFLAANG